MSRIWLVGSGPSLKDTPMHLLKNEDVMVMNKWNRISDYYKWDFVPTHYMKIDYNSFDKMSWKEEIEWAVSHKCKLFLWEQFKEGYPATHCLHEHLPSGVGEVPNVTWIKKCKDSAYQWNNYKATQSWHFPSLCTAFGGMSTMIQIAVMLGYSEIYLLGCDLGYTPDRTKNHAIPEYTVDESNKVEMDNGNMLTLHKMAKRCSPVPVYNATVGGQLEVYPRVDILQILKGN